MSPREKNGEPHEPVKAALDEFRKAWFAGNRLDPDEFCRDHPSCSEALRQRIEDFLFVAERLPHSGRFEGEEGGLDPGEEGALPDSVLGDFRIIREIGRGGQGTVYEVEQLSLKRKVALKVLPAHLSFSKDAILKFKREAEAGGKQSHPGIVAIHAVGEHKGVHYIAQELLEGGCTLADRLEDIRKKGELPTGYFRDVAKITAAVTDALNHAHESGVIHRDIKPSNILITPEGAPKVMDFGLAKVEGALALSRTGDFSGTPYYMSPEQVATRRIGIDERTDIYSLGVTLYEMLTLARPFEAETSQEILKKIMIHDPRDPRKLNQRVPSDLGMICLKAMEKEPKNRYQSMTEFGEDLKRFISGDVILARPSGFRIQAWKWLKRNPVLSTAGGVAFLAALAFLTYLLLWSYPQLKKERDRAINAMEEANAAREETEAQRQLTEVEKERALAAEKSAILAKEEAEKERERANDEADIANAEATTAKAVLDFLVGLFKSPDPKEARGAEITAKEILDDGVERIKEEFEDQPGIKARLLSTMGSVYESLGQFSDAEPLIEQALELHRTLPDVTQEKVLSSMQALASLYWRQGRYDESEALYLEVFEERRRTLGDDQLDTINTKVSLANLYKDQGRFEEAERLYIDGLKFLRRIRGNEHHDTLVVIMNLASLYNQVGKYEKSESLAHEALKGFISLLGDDHPATLNARNALSSSYLEQGKFKEANVFLVESLKYFRRVLGDDHPETLVTIGNLANSYMELGQYKEAEPLLHEALEGLRQALGNENPRTITFLQCLGALYWLTGRYEEAEPVYLEALEGFRRSLGDDHPKTIATMSTLAVLYRNQGRYEEVESLYTDYLDKTRQVLGDEHQDTFTAMINLGVFYGGMGRLGEAESLFIDALEGTRRNLGNDHTRTLSAMHNLAYNYAKQNRYEEAEKLFLESLQGRRRVLGINHPNTFATINGLAGMYLGQGRHEEAGPLYIEAVNGCRSALGDDHQTTLTAIGNLGNFYLGQGKLKEAAPLCLEGYEGLRRALGADHPSTLTALYNLIMVYMKSGRDKEAESLAVELVQRTSKTNKNYKIHKDLLEQIRKKLQETESGTPDAPDR